MPILEDDEIKTFIYEACEANNIPNVAQYITWKWNDRLTSTMGMARGLKVEFSPALFARGSEHDCMTTVKHEACHAIVYYKYGSTFSGVKPHGKEWRQAMVNCGLPPKRCHDVEVIPRSKKRWLGLCICRQHWLSTLVRNKILKGIDRYCTRCEGRLEMTNTYREIK